MKRGAAKIVPELQNFEHIQGFMYIAQKMLNMFNDDPDLLEKIIIDGESWVYCYNLEIKTQSSQWKHSEERKPKKALQVRSNVKVLLTDFFDCNGVMRHEFLPQGRTDNKEYYLEDMRRLPEATGQKSTELIGKTNHGYCTMITHQLSHRRLGVSFWPKTKL